MLKKLFLTLSLFLMNLCIPVFGGDIPIRIDPPANPSHPRAPFHIPLAASLENNNEVLLLFEYPIGIAVVSITDAAGTIVESRIIDTDQDDQASIMLDGYDSGSYTLHIEYGSIRLAGEFEIS